MFLLSQIMTRFLLNLINQVMKADIIFLKSTLKDRNEKYDFFKDMFCFVFFFFAKKNGQKYINNV